MSGAAGPRPVSAAFSTRSRAGCQDEVLRIAAIDELNRLNDHYLEDVGINRNDIGSIVDATVKRLRESRKRA
jgi:Domain of unknown function (DUF1127)